jgi:D-glycero-D-manno-heptose 1,7-bisphosphate phosphatase
LTLSGESGELVILDRDGVINFDSDEYIKTPDEWRPLPGSPEAIAALCTAGYRVVVVSNQSGVGRGLFTETALAAIDARMRATIEAAGGTLSGIYYCPHRPDEGCDCRKPAPGLLLRIARDFGQPLRGVPFIGDKLSDVEAALAVDARPILVRTGDGQRTAHLIADKGLEIFDDLAGAVEQLLVET